VQFSAFSRVALSREPFPTVSELLERWRSGDQQVLETLVPLVYNELRGLAHYHLRRERPGHTLQTTALVNEAYVRLARGRPFEAENRTHFVAIAARVMRQILVDYARNRGAAKRGTDRLVELNGIEDEPADWRGKPLAREVPSLDLVRLDDALRELARIDERRVVLWSCAFSVALPWKKRRKCRESHDLQQNATGTSPKHGSQGN